MQIKRYFLNNSLRNYQYILHDKDQAIVIDPLKATILDEFIKQNDLNLNTILITHKHGDHIAGVKQLVELYPNAKTYAYADNHLFKPDIYVKDENFVDLGFTSFKVIYTPGHIADHVSFLFDKEQALFCGDALFNAGVGNVYDKTADVNQLYDSLIKISNLDKVTKLYPAHDYWQSNLDFALSILPEEVDFNRCKKQVTVLEAKDKPIINLAQERKINIFIRAISDKSLLKALPGHSLGRDMFVRLRQLKDNF